MIAHYLICPFKCGYLTDDEADKRSCKECAHTIEKESACWFRYFGEGGEYQPEEEEE